MQLTLYSNYAGDNAGDSVEFMQVLRWYFCYCYVGGSFCCNYVGDCFCCNYVVEVFAAHTQVTVSAANMSVTIFVVIMQMEVSVAVMQLVFFAVHYVHDCFYCNYGGDSFIAMQVTVLSYNFIFLPLTDSLFIKALYQVCIPPLCKHSSKSKIL